MLKRVNITNYRSCRNVEIDEVGAITALIGRNGAGKSNILRAIGWAASSATSAVAPLQHSAFYPETSSDVTLEFEVDDTYFQYSALLEIIVTTSPATTKRTELLRCREDESWKIVASRVNADVAVVGVTSDTKLKIDLATPMLAALDQVVTDKAISAKCESARRFLSRVRYYPLNEVNEPRRSDREGFIEGRKFVEWAESSEPARYAEHEAPLRLLYMELFEPQKMEEVRKLLGPSGLQLFESIAVGGSGTHEIGVEPKQQIVFREKAIAFVHWVLFMAVSRGEMRLFEFRELSYGTRRVIDLIASIVFDGSAVMLIEHPEDGIHVGLLLKVLAVIRDYSEDAQFVFATHSRAMMDQLKLGELRFVSKSDQGTTVRALRGDELIQAERYISSEDSEAPTISEYVFSHREQSQ